MNKQKIAGMVALFVVLGGVAVYVNWPQPRPEFVPPAQAQKPPTSQESRQRMAEMRRQNEERAAKAEDQRVAPQDKFFADWSAQQARWKVVPTFVEEVYVEGSGKPWYRVEGSPRQFRRSIEAAAKGQTSLIRGGRVLLVDKSGRYWGISGGVNILRCFDGKTWSDERFAVGGPVAPTTRPADNYGKFNNEAFEDSAGNLFFIGGFQTSEGPDFGIHTRKPNGDWTYTRFPRVSRSRHPLDAQLSFMELPGGRVVIYPKLHVYKGPGAECRIYYFDGSTWAEMNPSICREPGHQIDAVVPLASGWIGSFCSGGRFWGYWPGQRPTEQIEKLVMELDHADARKREEAASSLLAMGPQILEVLRKLSHIPDSAEAKERFADVVATLEITATSDHARSGLQGGRFLVDYCYVASRTRDGGVRLHARPAIDRRTGKKHKEAYLTLSSQNEWDIQDIPDKDWDLAGLDHVPTRVFEDSRGRLWLPDGMRTTRAFSLEPAASEGLEWDQPHFEDAAGRVYLRAAPLWLVFDPAIEEAKPDLPRQQFRGLCIVHLSGEKKAWGVDNDEWPHTVFEVSADGYKSGPLNWATDLGIQGLIPLKDGFMVELFQRYMEARADGSDRYWDGAEWHKRFDINHLIHERAAHLATLVGPQFARWGRSQVHIAGDGKGHLWYYDRGYEMGPNDMLGGVATKYYERLEFFDGQKWRNLHSELNLPRGAAPLLTLAGGSELLISGPLQKINYDGSKFVQTKLFDVPPSAMGAGMSHIIEGPGGELFFRSSIKSLAAFSWKDGELKQLPHDVVPKLHDSRGRVWFAGYYKSLIFVKIGERWIGAEPELFPMPYHIVEGPDQRIWVIHLEGISQIEVEGPPEKPAIREISRHRLGGPKNAIRDIFIDSNNGFWFSANGRRITRFQLPPRSAQP